MTINQLKYILFIGTFYFLIIPLGIGQVEGHVTVENKDPLPFASVYVKGSTIGTTTNERGDYRLTLEPGTHTLVCEFLGYTPVERVVEVVRGERLIVHFQLTQKPIRLQELEISASREDPAYAIIRKAREHRRENLKSDMPQKCEMYMKGNIRLDSLPTSFFGIDLQEEKEEFDSIGLNILYLSETMSTLYRDGKELQEVIHSSRVSGSSMYSFNRGAMVEYSIYESSIQSPFGEIVNPIGPVAFSYYNYRLLSKDYVGEDVINRIKIWPKNEAEPTIDGIIHISEKEWKVEGFDFKTTGNRLKQEILDTIKLKQEYITVGNNKVLFKNTIDFHFKLFGFQVNGFFLAIYTDYEFGSGALSGLDRRQSVTFQDSSQTRDAAYWLDTRPIKLTEEEGKDYNIKDSIATVLDSPEYKDSVQKAMNTFSPMNLFMGYKYRNFNKGISFSTSGILPNIGFDAIRGFSIPFDASFRYQLTKLSGGVSYGLSDKQLRYHASISQRFHPLKDKELSFSIGHEMRNINLTEPFTKESNEFMSIFFHQNYIRYYDSHFYRLEYKQSLVPGFKWSVYGEYSRRESLINNSDYSFFYKDREYVDNEVNVEHISGISGLNNKHFQVGTRLDYYPGTRYTRYPGGEIRTYQRRNSKVSLMYRGALTFLNAEQDFHVLSLEYKDQLHMGIAGYGTVYTRLTGFLAKSQLATQDLIWVEDNGSFYINAYDVSRRFLGMDAYTYFTDDYAAEIHYHHNFSGLLLNKIPGVNKLGLNLVASASSLYMPDKPVYTEFSLGIDRIGWHMFRPFRFDVVMPIKGVDVGKLRYILGIKMSLSDFVGGDGDGITISF